MNIWRLMAACAVAVALLTNGTLVRAEDEDPHHAKKAGASEKAAHGDEHAQSESDRLRSMNPLAGDPDLAIFTLIVFVVLLAVLGKFAWKPIIAGLDKREQSIKDQIDEAKQSAEKAQATLAQYETRLAAAQEEVREMLAEARKDAAATKDKIVAEAQEAARRERERAVSDIHLAKDAAVRELAERSVDTAVALAGRMLSKEVDRKAHDQLIKDALEQFPSRN